MNSLSIGLGLASFLLLAATGQSITFSFAAGVAVLVMVSGIFLQEPNKKAKATPRAKKKSKKKPRPRKPASAKPRARRK